MTKKLRDYPVGERAAQLPLSDEDRAALRTGLSLEQAAHMIENVIATYALPLGVAQNFVINGRAIPAVPMAVEEASVVAACSLSARRAQPGGGFRAGASDPVMIGQIQTLDVPNPEAARAAIAAESAALVDWLNTGNDATRSRHARAIAIETRALPAEGDIPAMLIVHVLYDCGDAMGANLVNTACEALAPKIEALTGGRVNLRILSNLSDRRMAWAECVMRSNDAEEAGTALLIQEASYFAERDPYRAATHNKGIMNGIDAVALATGNDWRAIEAGAHAYAARNGRYSALATWRIDAQGDLHGRIALPLAVGIVGGATRVHPSAQAALRVLGVTRASELAQIMACVGLAQNFGALRALVTTGIQSGHMRLHARQIAAAAGATGPDIERVAAQLVAEKRVRLERAKEILQKSSQGS